MQTSALKIVENMSDIIAYAHPVIREGQPRRILTLRSADNSIRCGCRFKYMVPEIDFSYDNLVKALNDAIDSISQYGDFEWFVSDDPVPTGDSDNDDPPWDDDRTDFDVR